MIGKPEWFGRRKYTGWGIVPKTWQGWAYIAAFLVPFAVFNALPFWSPKIRWIASAVWIGIVFLDVIHIMLNLKKDERETLHEAISDRNSAWFMVLALAVGLVIDAYSKTGTGNLSLSNINPFIAVALVGGLLVKAISNIYLDRRG